MKKVYVAGAVVLGVICIIASFVYFTTVAGHLPAWLPGHEAGSIHIHHKHGIGTLILGLGLFAYAWFKSAPEKPTTTPAEQPAISE